MDIKRIRQAMVKQAAGHSILYRNTKDVPGGPAAYIRGVGGADDKYKDEGWSNFQKQTGNWQRIGATPYSFSPDTDNKTPVIDWKLRTPKAGGGTAEYKTRTFPNQSISARIGAWLMSPSFQYQQQTAGSNSVQGAQQKSDPLRIYTGRPGEQLTDDIINAANAGRAQLTLQPFTNEQLMKIMTLDPKNRNYMNELLRHYSHIPLEAWHKGNLQPSSPEEIEAWKKDKPSLNNKNNNQSGTYYSDTGNISLDPTGLFNRYLDGWGSKAFAGRWTNALSQEAYTGNLMTSSPVMAGLVGDTYGHELGHRYMMGQTKATRADGPLKQEHSRKAFNPKKPVSSDNVPALMSSLDFRPLSFDAQQYEWLKNRAIQSYAVNENEMNQALTSFNRGRWALKQDMINNPDNPNYKYLEENYPGLIDKFKALPDFIPAGNAGKAQLDSMMQLFADNPQLKVLIPEQARLVGYYQNLKAAVDNADTPEEKQFFQNLMDRFIYSKSFLANNQKRPTYNDALSMMA